MLVPASSSTPPKTPCFSGPGDIVQSGEWEGQGWEANWMPSEASGCRGLASLLNSSTASLSVEGLRRRPWVVIVGDSNFRKEFVAIASHLEKQGGVALQYVTPKVDPSGGHSDQRWADREVLHMKGTADDFPFRITFMFFRSLEKFSSVHMHPAGGEAGGRRVWDFQQLYEVTGERVSDQLRFDAVNAMAAVEETRAPSAKAPVPEAPLGVPDTLIFSTGLWDFGVSTIDTVLRALTDLGEREAALRVLYVTQSKIGRHPSITNAMTKAARDEALRWVRHERRRKAALKAARVAAAGSSDAGLRGSLPRPVAGVAGGGVVFRPDFVPSILDLWPMTSTAQPDFVSKGGGYHYTDWCDCVRLESCPRSEISEPICDPPRHQTPVSRAVLSLIWSFAAGNAD